MFSSQEYLSLTKLVPDAIENTIFELNRKGFSSRENYDDLFCVFSNLLIRPEFIDYSSFHSIEELLDRLSDLDIVSSILSDDFYLAFFDSVSYFMMRIKYEYNLSMKKQYLDKRLINEHSYNEKLNILKESEEKLWIATERMLSLTKK